MDVITHTLVAKGAAFDDKFNRLEPAGTGGEGRAACACGWTSEVLPSGKQRVAAHKGHKFEACDACGSTEDHQTECPHFVPEDEDLIGDVVTDDDGFESTPVEEPVPDLPKPADTHESAEGLRELAAKIVARRSDKSQKQVEEERSFPGNYSISYVPFAEELADAYGGLETRRVIHSDKLDREVFFKGGRTDVKDFLELLDVATEQSRVALRDWQKANRAERRDLTDMQKYLQHREFITNFGTALAQYIRGL